MPCFSHEFEEVEKKAIGCWEKRAGGGDAIFFSGAVEQCLKCQVIQFVPDNNRASPVELFPFNSVLVKSKLLRAAS